MTVRHTIHLKTIKKPCMSYNSVVCEVQFRERVDSIIAQISMLVY